MKILLIILILMLLFVLGSMLLGWIFSAPVYHGPVSDHFNGKTFINPGNVKPEGLGGVLKWAMNREKGEWTEDRDAAFGPAPARRVKGDTVVVTFVNHSTFLIQTQGLNILTDPVWSERVSPVPFAGPKRMRPPGIRFEDLPHIDLILLTHNHYDHLDIRTVQQLVKLYQPAIYTPLGVGQFLQRKGIGKVTEMDWWDELPVQGGMTLLCTPAQHFSGRGMYDRDRTLWAGFALMTAQGSIYFSGDTGFGDFFREIAAKIAPVRLSFLPIGAYKPAWFMSPIHTSPSDAVKIHQILGSPQSIGMHFGTFPLADDGMNDPENDLKTAMKAAGVDEARFIIPEEGAGMRWNGDLP